MLVTFTVICTGCSVTSHDLRDSAQVAGRVASVQHLERVEWHRNVDENGHILDTGDEQFTVLNSATVTNDSLQILTGVGERLFCAVELKELAKLLRNRPQEFVQQIVRLLNFTGEK